MPTETRPQRVCDSCGQVDDHPRHVIHYAPGTAPAPDPALVARVAGNQELTQEVRDSVIADLLDTSVQLRHMDCCSGAGCPDGSCNVIHAMTPGEEVLRGNDLLEHLTSGAVDDVGTDLNDERAAEADAAREVQS